MPYDNLLTMLFFEILLVAALASFGRALYVTLKAQKSQRQLDTKNAR